MASRSRSRNVMNSGIGRRPMASPGSSLERQSAENLQHSRRNTKTAQRARRKSRTWFLGSWNVRSLLDYEGPVETARQHPRTGHFDDRRIDQVVRELERYKISVAALQETKWFADAVYRVGESIVIAAGRPIPPDGEIRQRGEGVAIVLNGPAVQAWEAGGKQWKAWSSRVVTATLLTGKRAADRIHILSCYAPTFAANRTDKEKFKDEVQQAMNAIPPSECYVIMGDFNARVGSRLNDDDPWTSVRGPHGFGDINDSGRELLTFLAINEATLCNTWFCKKDIYKQTWKHPKTKKWHCIDFAIMRQRDRKRCLDACVKRGAECNSDHQLLRIKMKMTGKRGYQQPRNKKHKRFNVSHLTSRAEADRQPYRELVCRKVTDAWVKEGNVEEQWSAIKTGLVGAAEEVLGHEERRQPDWFRDNVDVLEPLFQQRNQLYTKWLGSGNTIDRQKFVKARLDARKALRNTKDTWFRSKADATQQRRFGGKEAWQSIRDMQRACRGLISQRTGTIKDEEGYPCTSVDAQQQRWRRHFTGILNVESQYNHEELDRIRQRPMRPKLTELPSMEELVGAIGKLKNGKAGGSSGIRPEMVKVACQDPGFADQLLDLVHTTWKDQLVPKDWTDAVLIPIPKKGDLSKCDNWRGISLLDVVGKVIARILQDRLQKLAEDELPESQCGFRKGRGCSDMIFAIRQLVEKSWEHRTKAFFLFIDLKKAYDSVPREALWQVLHKLGIPDPTIQLIKAFHQDMQATIQLDGKTLEPIDVDNGLRQGCCMAPVLFNLYACVFVERWLARIENLDGVGLTLKYKHDQKLFRRYTRNAEETRLTELQFADDAALLAKTREGAENAIRMYMEVANDFGLSVSIPKTKLMVSGREARAEDSAPIPTGDEQVESVTEFTYLGSVISSTGRMQPDIDKRIAQASRAFGALRQPVFNNRDLRVETKREVYQACVLSILLYGAECWTPLRKDLKRLDSFHHRCIRKTLGITNQQQWDKHITSQSIRRQWGDIETMSEKVTKRRLEWLGHLARMPDNRTPKVSLFSWLPEPRPQGGPPKRWRDVIRSDLKDMQIPEDTWYAKATTSREEWRNTYREARTDITHREQHRRQADNWVQCPECSRTFRRESDMKRHKCLVERRKPIHEQRGAAQCSTCKKWFKSRGGFTVHSCNPDQ